MTLGGGGVGPGRDRLSEVERGYSTQRVMRTFQHNKQYRLKKMTEIKQTKKTTETPAPSHKFYMKIQEK